MMRERSARAGGAEAKALQGAQRRRQHAAKRWHSTAGAREESIAQNWLFDTRVAWVRTRGARIRESHAPAPRSAAALMAPKGHALDATFDRDLLEEGDPLVVSYSALQSETGETNARASHRHGTGHCGCLAKMNTTSKVLLWLSLALVATVFGIAVWKTPSPPSETSFCEYEGYRLPTVGGRPLLEPSLYKGARGAGRL